MCKHMVDGNEQKGHGKTTAVSEDAEAEIFITFKWKQYRRNETQRCKGILFFKRLVAYASLR